VNYVPLADTIDVSLRGVLVLNLCHETFAQGVMAPTTRIRVRDRLRVLCKEVMERFCDVIRNPNELFVRGRRMHALCHEVINCSRSIT
jgi:hypothetical protein